MQAYLKYLVLRIGLSLLPGIWSATRTQPIELEQVPGTSVWWPPAPASVGERLPAGVGRPFDNGLEKRDRPAASELSAFGR